MTKKIGLGILLAMLATAASAAQTSSSCTQQPTNFWDFIESIFNPGSCGSGGSGGGKPVSAPEIDPASAMAGFTLLGAGLTVLRGRRKIK